MKKPTDGFGPYLPLYTQTFLSDPKVIALPVTLRMQYLWYLVAAWNYGLTAGTVDLPDDPGFCQGLLQLTAKQWTRLRAVLLDRGLLLSADGFLKNPRLSREFSKSWARWNAMREGGAKGGRQSAEKRRHDAIFAEETAREDSSPPSREGSREGSRVPASLVQPPSTPPPLKDQEKGYRDQDLDLDPVSPTSPEDPTGSEDLTAREVFVSPTASPSETPNESSLRSDSDDTSANPAPRRRQPMAARALRERIRRLLAQDGVTVLPRDWPMRMGSVVARLLAQGLSEADVLAAWAWARASPYWRDRVVQPGGFSSAIPAWQSAGGVRVAERPRARDRPGRQSVAEADQEILRWLEGGSDDGPA